jgi:hypothetical protein
MIGVELPARTGAEAVRVVRALGTHRYALGRMHLVHAFAIAAAHECERLAQARAWALEVLANDAIDASSKDERLWRRATGAELALVLESFWASDSRALAHARLRELLARADLAAPPYAPFDEAMEDELHPLLIDAGWELLPLASLDAERHRGAIAAFGEPILFEAAAFEEESAIPPPAYLHELPAMGAVELLDAVDADGAMRAPLTLWTSGHETYQDYVVRGVTKIAKLETES